VKPPSVCSAPSYQWKMTGNRSLYLIADLRSRTGPGGMGEVRISGLLRHHKMLNVGKCVRRRWNLRAASFSTQDCGKLGTIAPFLRQRLWRL
jgi:hypothetical protein